MTFYAENESEDTFDFDYEKQFRLVAEAVLDEEQCPYETEISLLITGEKQIRELNREHREIDCVTDVLSFPLIQYEKAGDFSGLETQEKDCFNPETGELMLGDIVICARQAFRQAEEYGHSVLREFSFLIAHSVLHLCGYDHILKEDMVIMEDKQKKILDVLGIRR